MKFIDPNLDPWTKRLLAPEQWLTTPERSRDECAADATAGTGLSLPNDYDIEALAGRLAPVQVIALQFPKWTDGRAYSQARLLRARLRFRGEIRATGEVLVDMLPLLARTGFDAAVLRADQKLDAARRALDFFPGHYQGDVIEPQPWFARRAA